MSNLKPNDHHDDLEIVIRVKTAAQMVEEMENADAALRESMREFAEEQLSRRHAEQDAAINELLPYYDPLRMRLVVNHTPIPWNLERNWIELDEKKIPFAVILELARNVHHHLSTALGTCERTPEALSELLHELNQRTALRN